MGCPSPPFRGSLPFVMGEAQPLLSGTRWRPDINAAGQGGQGPLALGLAGPPPPQGPREVGVVILRAAGRRPEGHTPSFWPQPRLWGAGGA